MRKYFVLAITLTLAATLTGPFLSSAQNSTSATFTVNSLSDTPDASLADGICADTSGACTLRAAIQQANSDSLPDTIGFAVTGTINVTSALPDLSTNITISGPGANQLTVRRNTEERYRIFRVNVDVTAAISGLSVTNGRAAVQGAKSLGGGILNSGTLVLSDCVVNENSTAPADESVLLEAGGGGGIRNEGTLTMSRSIVSGNSTGEGGINDGRHTGTEGGGIFNSGVLTMIDCAVVGNATAGDAMDFPIIQVFDVSAGGGGGIRNDGTLTMTGCTVSNNATGSGALTGRGFTGSAGGSGGGVSNSGTLSMNDCVVSGNSTGNGGDTSPLAGNGGHGGGISNLGQMTLTSCSVSQNRTGRGGHAVIIGFNGKGGAGGDGGGIFGAATVIRSTINDNAAGSGGAGALNGGRGGSGGGIYGSVAVSDSTISGNSAGRGGNSRQIEDVSLGNGGDGGGIFATSTLKLSNSTVAFNAAGLAGNGRDGLGGGVHVTVNVVAQIRSSIVALNTSPPLIKGRDVFGVFESSGYNYIGISSGGCCFSDTDLVNFDAGFANIRLGPLADNGGLTLTHALLPGSPAIDKGLGRNVDDQPAVLDQRGFPRPFDDPALPPQREGDNSDIGAFERQSADPSPSPTPTSTTVHFSSATYEVTEGCAPAEVTVKRSGPLEGTTAVAYVIDNQTASQRGDFTYDSGRITFAPGEDTRTITVLISDDAYAEGVEHLNIFLAEVTGGTLGTPNPASVHINDNETIDGTTNPVDDAASFVCQHYHDFLGRQADFGGLAFWSNQITSCGTDPGCLAEKRENVSAAFFLSIEFQQTGYYVIRVNKAAFGYGAGNPDYSKFIAETRQIGRGLVVGQSDFAALLEANKQRYLEEFVTQPEFQWVSNRSAQEYVDLLFANANVTPTPAERDAAISVFGSGDTTGLARALQSVVETRSVYDKLYNSGFVLMQYFGYLRRNPSDPPDNNFNGYNFWLTKLNSFTVPGENVRDDGVALARVKRAEMVRAFITSGEYRGRFLGDPNRGQ